MAAWCSDRVGRRPMLLAATLLMMVTCIMCGCATSVSADSCRKKFRSLFWGPGQPSPKNTRNPWNTRTRARAQSRARPPTHPRTHARTPARPHARPPARTPIDLVSLSNLAKTSPAGILMGGPFVSQGVHCVLPLHPVRLWFLAAQGWSGSWLRGCYKAWRSQWSRWLWPWPETTPVRPSNDWSLSVPWRADIVGVLSSGMQKEYSIIFIFKIIGWC